MLTTRNLLPAGVAAGLLFCPPSLAQAPVDAAQETKSPAPEFAAPVRLKGGAEFMKTESPGYAAPCVFDIDGDGHKDLIVGQFSDGKMRIYRGLGQNKFAKGEWLEAGGRVAQVPGVW